MQLTLTNFTKQTDGDPGDRMTAEIQQMGSDTSPSETTTIHVDTSEEHRDIRIADGDQVVKIVLARTDYTIQEIYQNDVPITAD